MKKPIAKISVRAPAKAKRAAKSAPASLKVKQAAIVKAEAKAAAARPHKRHAAPVSKFLAPPSPIAETAPLAVAEAPVAPTARVAPAVAPLPPPPPRPSPPPTLTGELAPAPAELRRVPAAPAPRGFATGVVRPGAIGGIASGRPLIGPPPRPPAPAENFVEGDHVVYPTHGVGKIERIVTESIAGYRLELIHITFEENRMTLRVPVEKARSAGLRKLASRQLFDAALTTLRGRARIKRTMWSRRAQEYEAKINSGDPMAIAEVVRDLHRNAGQPDQSFSERQIYEAAMDRLAAELAALDKTDKATAAEKLTTFMKSA